MSVRSASHQDPQRWFDLGVAEGLQVAGAVDPDSVGLEVGDGDSPTSSGSLWLTRRAESNVPPPGPTWVGNKTQPSAVVRIPFPGDSSSTRRIHQPRAQSPKRRRSGRRRRDPGLVQAGINEADEPRSRLRPEPDYRAISGIVGMGPHRRHSRDRRSQLFALRHSGGPLSTGTANLVPVLRKRGSMNSPLHWQGGQPPWCGPPTPSRIW
jgi:hypothetical protein